MNTFGIGSHAGHAARTANAGVGADRSSAFASTLAAAMEGARQTGGGNVQAPDFTHMTRKDLADWVNARIKSGEMSLAGSESFVAMTLKMPVDGAYTGLDDTEQVDFMQSARDGMAWARQHHDMDLLKGLEAALDTMRRYQGRIGSVNPTA